MKALTKSLSLMQTSTLPLMQFDKMLVDVDDLAASANGHLNARAAANVDEAQCSSNKGSRVVFH
jgi:hypothetical protein